MARTSDAPATGPKNDVYFGMLVLTAVSMAFGVLLMLVEWGEYGWETNPKPAPAVSLPPPVPPLADAPPPATTARPQTANLAASTPVAPPVLPTLPSAAIQPNERPTVTPIIVPLPQKPTW